MKLTQPPASRQRERDGERDKEIKRVKESEASCRVKKIQTAAEIESKNRLTINYRFA